METIMMNLQTTPNNVLNVVEKDTTLFQKVEIRNNLYVYDFDENQLVEKLELLLIKFDEIFRA